jgi:hypothetical protein
MRERMRDAAFAQNIDPAWTGIAGGYLFSLGQAFHPWPVSDWNRFPGNKKLPILMQKRPGDAASAQADAFTVLQELYNLCVPAGTGIVLDLETAVNAPYTRRFGRIMHYFDYRVYVYGSASTLFRNPPLDGYWVAAPAKDGKPYMYPHDFVEMTQYALDVKPGIDRSTVRWRTQLKKWWV